MRGITIIFFALLRFIWIGWFAGTSLAFLFLVSLDALIGGTLSIVAGYKAYSDFKTGWLLIVDGVFGIVAVAMVLTRYQFHLAGAGALYVWLMIAGAVRIGAALQLRKHLKQTWLLAAAGAVSALSGFALLVTWLLDVRLYYTAMATYNFAQAVVLGCLLIAFGLLTRKKTFY